MAAAAIRCTEQDLEQCDAAAVKGNITNNLEQNI